MVTERDFGDRGEEWDVGVVEFESGAVGKCEFFPLGRESAAWAPDLRKVVGTRGVCGGEEDRSTVGAEADATAAC